MQKPKLDDFLKKFQQSVDQVNNSYQNTKQQFEYEMKKFRDYRDIIDEQNEQEAQLIQNALGETAEKSAPTPSFNKKKLAVGTTTEQKNNVDQFSGHEILTNGKSEQ